MAAFVGVFATAVAALWAGPQPGFALDREPPRIIGGQEAPTCGWPSVVLLATGDDELVCTGTLIHPSIVLTAAHCIIPQLGRIYFGEGAENFTELSEIEYCRENPDWPGRVNPDLVDNRDYAFCKLVVPVLDVPIIPVAYGCELDLLVPGREAASVGFGRDAAYVSGIKQFVSTEIVDIHSDGEIELPPTTCHGDSGGPHFIAMDDGSLRQVGITSYGAPTGCTEFTVATAAAAALPFIEEETGLDVTPCHTIDGAWDSTWACQQIPTQPWVGGDGDYATGCPAGPVSDFAETCGPPLTDTPDDDPPAVSFVEPAGDVELDLDVDETAPLRVEVDADDGTGWGIGQVDLVIAPVDGPEAVEPLVLPAYVWRLVLGKGAYHIKAIAHDNAEHASETAWVGVGVGVPAPPPRDDDDDSGSSGGGESTGDGTDDGATEPPDTTSEPDSPTTDAEAPTGASGDDGCGCAAATGHDRAGLLLLLWIFALQTRRREARGPV